MELNLPQNNIIEGFQFKALKCTMCVISNFFGGGQGGQELSLPMRKGFPFLNLYLAFISSMLYLVSCYGAILK